MQVSNDGTRHLYAAHDDPSHKPDGSDSAKGGNVPRRQPAVDAGKQPSIQQDPPTAPPAASSGIPPAEAEHLIAAYEGNASHPGDSENATALAGLQADGFRGMPQDEVQFNQHVTQALQKTAALPQQAREQYLGAVAEAVNEYGNTTAPADRQAIASKFEQKVQTSLDAAYQKVMGDPAQRVQLEFTAPYGAQYEGAAGRQQVALLGQLGKRFNEAKTPRDREALFQQSAGARQSLQQQIGGAIVRGHAQAGDEWAKADKELDNALNYAKDLQGTGADSFSRLQAFAEKAFTSPRNAQELLYRTQNDPQHFQPLKDWYKDAAQKSADAGPKLPYFASLSVADYGLRNGVRLPDPPQDFTNIKTDDLRPGAFAGDLLYRYQKAYKDLGENARMCSAVSQGGPMEKEFVASHMPARPEWLQKTEDVLGRFAVGLVPGVNLLTDYLAPARSLTSDERAGIDIFSGVVGGMLGEAKLPGGKAAGEAREEPKKGADTNTGSEGEGGTAAGGAGSGSKLPGANERGVLSGLDAPTAASKGGGVPNVPDTYVNTAKRELTADPAFRGIYRDNKGQAFIQQGDKTYGAAYDKDNGTWRVQSPEGGTKPSYAVRLDSNGNWEMNPDTGLRGGAAEKYTDALGSSAYHLYASGYSFKEVATELDVGVSSAHRWVARYARENGLPQQQYGMFHGPIGMSKETGRAIYNGLSNGQSLQAVADAHTNGDTMAAYRSAMRYARSQNVSGDPIVRAKTRDIGVADPRVANPPPAGQHASPQPHADPMARQQYEQIGQLYDQGNSTPDQIAQATGVPEPAVRDVEHGFGYWSPSRQAYIEPSYDPEQPAAKRQRVDDGGAGPSGGAGSSGGAGPSGAQSASPSAAATAGPGWGRNELRQYINDSARLDDATFDDIYEWLNNKGPVPAGLQQEMIDQGYPALTADVVRNYLDPHGDGQLTTAQLASVAQWLDV